MEIRTINSYYCSGNGNNPHFSLTKRFESLKFVSPRSKVRFNNFTFRLYDGKVIVNLHSNKNVDKQLNIFKNSFPKKRFKKWLKAIGCNNQELVFYKMKVHLKAVELGFNAY